MTRFTANISMLFTEHPFLDRFDAARSAGFHNVECHAPYDFETGVLKRRLDLSGLRLTGINTAMGDTDAGDWGLAAVPDREEEFWTHFLQALNYAVELNVRFIHVLAGRVPAGRRKEALATYENNIRRSAALAKAANITLLLEPLNRRDVPGYVISASDELAALIRKIDEPNVRLLFDVYHIQIEEGDLITRLHRHRDVIGHVQIAGVPARAEPDHGEIHYPAVLQALADCGYQELVGLEYRPRGRTEDGLTWMKDFTS